MADFRAANGFHQGLLKTGSNGHDFPCGLHLSAQGALGINEFIKGPAGHFYHGVVQSRLKGCIGLAGDLIFDFIEVIADGNESRCSGNGVAGGFTCQGRRTGHTGVYFDHGVFKGGRVQGKLAVATAVDTEGRNDF